MQHFLKLIELANKDGCVTKYKNNTARFFPLGEDDAHTFENCQPIVFTPKNDEPEELTEAPAPDNGPVTADLDVPFKFFSYEMSVGPVTSPRPGDEIQAYCWCVIVCELGPKQFGFYGLMENREEQDFYVVKTNSFAPITEEFLKRLNTEKVGQTGSRTSVKIGRGKTKRRFRIKRVVYVAQKKWVSDHQASGGHIDFTHRFLVRGHWRKIEVYKMGKDRSGNYCVTGHTWVTEFEKGHGPLITKTRIVE